MGTLAAAFTLWLGWRYPDTSRDFDQFWFAARSALAGHNPYALIGPDNVFEWPWPFVYPLTSAVVILPLAPLPLLAARSIFVGLSVGLLAFAMPRRLLIPLLVSQPFVNALWNAQWAPLLTAAMLLPALGMLGAVKPNVGVALLAYASDYRQLRLAVAGGILITIVALLLYPFWLVHWWQSLRSATHFVAPAMQLGGPVLLLSALRWREPRARLLLALSLVPQTPMWYSALPLFVVPKTMAQATLLAGLSQVAFYATAILPHSASFEGQVALTGMLMLYAVYIPALLLILCSPAEPRPHANLSS